MLLAFHNAFENDRLSDSAIDFILPTLTKELSNEFCRFVDGGAGIGGTAIAYNRILESNLDNDIKEQACIVCYEPLIENFSEMSKRLAQTTLCRLRNVAIAGANGTAKFAVPSRLQGNSESWGQGTSYNGFLGDRGGYMKPSR